VSCVFKAAQSRIKRWCQQGHSFRTKSDSEVNHLYEEIDRIFFCNLLDGDFAFVVLNGDDFMAARDPLE
jgi:asparagine synthase (glutamine-hydrolysing)